MTAATREPLAARAYRVRERILAMGASPHGTHLGGSLSAADVLTVLYTEVLRVHPDEPDRPDRDWFVLSKGHASAALYAVLAEAGFLDPAELATYGQHGGRLAGHPLRRLPGVEFPTGSLGHGLGLATGVAVAQRATGSPFRSYVLLGDGELQEGSVWEAAMLAGHQGLDNLVAIVDRNGLQITGPTEDAVRLEPLAERWAGLGWAVEEVDGHDLAGLHARLTTLPLRPGRPSVLIARTVKGAGVATFEGKKKAHFVQLTPRLYQRAVADLRRSGGQR